MNADVLNMSQRSLTLFSFLFCFLYSVLWQWFFVLNHSVFQFTYLFFASLILLLIFSSISLISIIVFILDYFFFKYSCSLLNISYIFLVSYLLSVQEICHHLYHHYLNCFSGRLPISTSLSCSSRVLSHSFIWNIFLCHLILSNFLCSRLQDCSYSHYGVCFLVCKAGLKVLCRLGGGGGGLMSSHC